MDAFKISVKLFVSHDTFGHAEFVPVFHRWIQEHVLEDHLLIDVADYAHVPNGPGTLLVTHEANIYMDRTGGRLGLMYQRKLPLAGSFGDRLRSVVASTLKVAAKLQEEPNMQGRLTFRTGELSIRIHDRLLAPNTPATQHAVRGDVQSLADTLYGKGAATIEFPNDPQGLFEVRVKAPTTSSNVAELLAKVSLVGV